VLVIALSPLDLGASPIAIQPIGAALSYLICRQSRASLERAFPNSQNSPSGVSEPLLRKNVSSEIPIDFVFPEIFSARRPAKQMAIVPMPKTPVRKQNGPILGKNHIWPSRQSGRMQSVSKALFVQQLPKQQFGLCIFPPNAAHHAAANLRRDDISHEPVC
jgi:hypothetical protein